MASVSSATSSLGNTSLRGYGGMASGIERDEIIEQMTLGTTTKIANKRKEITSAEWKQEAYRDVIDKIIDMEDTYYTYSSTESLLNRSFFSKNQVTAQGDSDATKYISASGNSSMLDYVSILGVKQMATASSLRSGVKGADTSITTGITGKALTDAETQVSNLQGKKLELGHYDTEGKWVSVGTFTFPSSYKDADGNTVTVDYTNSEKLPEDEYLEKLAGQLNSALKDANITLDNKNIADSKLKFSFSDGKLQITGDDASGRLKIRENCSALSALGFDKGNDSFSGKWVDGRFQNGGISFSDFNTHATTDFVDSAIKDQTLADYMTGKTISVTYAGQTKNIALVTADELKEFDRLTAEKKAAEEAGDSDGVKKIEEDALKYLQENIQERLNKAFGGFGNEETDPAKAKTNVSVKTDGGVLSFLLGSNFTDAQKASGEAPVLSVTNSSAEVRKNLGIVAGASNKVSLDASLYENRAKLGITEADIDGKVEAAYDTLKTRYQDLKQQYDDWVTGLDPEKRADLDAIPDADKPSYVKEYQQLEKDLTEMGIKDSIEAGTAYEDLSDAVKTQLQKEDNGLKKEAFEELLQEMSINGVTGKDLKLTADTTVNQFMNALNKNADAGVKITYLSASNEFAMIASETGSGRTFQLEGAAKAIFGDPEDGTLFTEGKNAQMAVSYGNGIETTIESSGNTFNLDGLKVTVSGEFGYVRDADGNTTDKLDRTKAVTFNAKADADAAVERVKKFIEAYNELVDKVSTEITTKPDSDYGPLTDEQKEEMDETSIENWEKKAKQGLLFGDANLRGLSDDLQTVMVSLIKNGINTNDMESIGISMSSDWYDGGKLVFNESKFRQAMNDDPDKVADIICGGGDVKTGLVTTIGDKLGTYATRLAYKHNGSYGSLVQVAGTEKLSSTIQKNQIYEQLKQMQEDLERLKTTLSTEQDRYINQFTTMETLISQMNSQASYLSSLSVG